MPSRAGEKQGGAQKANDLAQLLGTTPQSPFQGQLAVRPWARHNPPGVMSCLCSTRGDPVQPNIGRAQCARVGRQEAVPKVGSSKEAGDGLKENLLDFKRRQELL